MKKSFDCVALQHEGARRIYEETKDLTFEQKLEYWRKKDAEMMRQQRLRLQKNQKNKPRFSD